jgi:hypothetical protein
MKKLLAAAFLICAGCCGSVNGDEGWGPYVYQPPISIQQAPAVQNFQMIQYYAPTVIMAPVVPLFVPVTSYQNVVVERRYCCFFKRYEVVTLPQTVYVPNRY